MVSPLGPEEQESSLAAERVLGPAHVLRRQRVPGLLRRRFSNDGTHAGCRLWRIGAPRDAITDPWRGCCWPPPPLPSHAIHLASVRPGSAVFCYYSPSHMLNLDICPIFRQSEFKNPILNVSLCSWKSVFSST